MNELTIIDTPIRLDGEGRYSLNDLHRAAGSEAKHQPSNWLRLDQTQALCAEIDQSSDVRSAQVVVGGTAPGTYVAKELVYAYAMWISAAFHLKVIRAFDAMMTAEREGHRQRRGRANFGLRELASEFQGGLSIAKIAGLKGNQAILAASKAVKVTTGTDPLALIGETQLVATEQVRHYTPTELGKRYGESGQAFNRRLEHAGLQIRNTARGWTATPKGEPFAVLLDTGKAHSNGTPIQQLRWLESVMDALTAPAA
ncbi:KilA-N domain-containing protein [Dokdonella ginsengisoli]|uniref:KilA-N domain-containing protein n=1 Tax=Dokdonella ginsengisoli TaxID=363846 RepID=A0ABV9QXJ4_9GAMM